MGLFVKLALLGASLAVGGGATVVALQNDNSPSQVQPNQPAFQSNPQGATQITDQIIPSGVSCWFSPESPAIPAGQTSYSFQEGIGVFGLNNNQGFQIDPGEIVYGTEFQYVDSSGISRPAVNVLGTYEPASGRLCQNYSNYVLDPFKFEELASRGLVSRNNSPVPQVQVSTPVPAPAEAPAQSQGNSTIANQNGDSLPPLPPKIPYNYSSALLPTWQQVNISSPFLSRLGRFSEIPGALNFNGNGGTYDEWEGACHVARTLTNIEEFEQILGENYFNLNTPVPDNLTDPETGKVCGLFHPLARYGNAEILDAYLKNDKAALGIEIERYRRERGLNENDSAYVILSKLLSETSNGLGLNGYYQMSESYGIPVVFMLAIGETEHHNRGGDTFQCSLGTNPTGVESFNCALNHSSGDISAMSSRYGANSYAEAILAYNRGKSGAPIMIDALNALP